jgi:hypothetical protein
MLWPPPLIKAEKNRESANGGGEFVSQPAREISGGRKTWAISACKVLEIKRRAALMLRHFLDKCAW